MKKFMTGLAIAAIASSAFVGAVSAQDRVDAGNGGVSTSNASGGTVGVGDTDTGSATGSTSVINAGELLGSEDLAAQIIALVLAAQGQAGG